MASTCVRGWSPRRTWAWAAPTRQLLAEVAGAQQLLHLGLCMHDDLIDGDRVRHGTPNLIGRSHDAALAAGTRRGRG